MGHDPRLFHSTSTSLLNTKRDFRRHLALGNVVAPLQVAGLAARLAQLSLRGVVAGLIQPLRPNSRLIELGARCTLLKTQLDHRAFFTTQVFVVLTRCEAVLNGTR